MLPASSSLKWFRKSRVRHITCPASGAGPEVPEGGGRDRESLCRGELLHTCRTLCFLLIERLVAGIFPSGPTLRFTGRFPEQRSSGSVLFISTQPGYTKRGQRPSSLRWGASQGSVSEPEDPGAQSPRWGEIPQVRLEGLCMAGLAPSPFARLLPLTFVSGPSVF